MLEKWLKEKNYEIERTNGYIVVTQKGRNGYQISCIQSDEIGRIYAINFHREIVESIQEFSKRASQVCNDAIELSELLKND